MSPDLHVCETTGYAYRAGQYVRLRKMEITLVRKLLEGNGQAVEHFELSAISDNHRWWMSQLRRKLGDDTVYTVRNFGYGLRAANHLLLGESQNGRPYRLRAANQHQPGVRPC